MTDQQEQKATIGTLRIPVATAAPLIRHYARLGLRVVRQGRGEAVIELPCGILLVLSETGSVRRASAA